MQNKEIKNSLNMIKTCIDAISKHINSKNRKTYDWQFEVNNFIEDINTELDSLKGVTDVD